MVRNAPTSDRAVIADEYCQGRGEWGNEGTKNVTAAPMTDGQVVSCWKGDLAWAGRMDGRVETGGDSETSRTLTQRLVGR